MCWWNLPCLMKAMPASLSSCQVVSPVAKTRDKHQPWSGQTSLVTFGDFEGGVTEAGGFHTPVRGTMFVRNGAVTPRPSRECDITFFAKGRPKSVRQSRDSKVAARVPENANDGVQNGLFPQAPGGVSYCKVLPLRGPILKK